MDDHRFLRKLGAGCLGNFSKPVIAIQSKVVIVVIAREHMHAIQRDAFTDQREGLFPAHARFVCQIAGDDQQLDTVEIDLVERV